MSDQDVALIRRAWELFVEGDRDGAWAHWAEDAVAIPPRDWPEGASLVGRDQIRAQFDSWDEAFGHDWTTQMTLERAVDLGDGRVMVELGFESSGVGSGVPIEQQMAGIYAVRDGKVVRAEFFIGHGEARKAAGLE